MPSSWAERKQGIEKVACPAGLRRSLGAPQTRRTIRIIRLSARLSLLLLSFLLFSRLAKQQIALKQCNLGAEARNAYFTVTLEEQH